MLLDKFSAITGERSLAKTLDYPRGFRRQLVDSIPAVCWPRRIARVTIDKLCLLELVYCLSSDRFAAVGSVVFIKMVAHPSHNIDNS